VTLERFNQLLNGLVYQASPEVAVARLTMALWAVVQATGTLGEQTLETHCAERQPQDEAEMEDD
jgi:hypothetical protein